MLLVITVALATILVKGLASRDEENPGIVVGRWRTIQQEIGKDLPDQCVGGDCGK